MIKKYTILTLILNLITTQSYAINPESVSKAINFFQDTRKSFFQRVMEYLQEKMGVSYAQEKEKEDKNQNHKEFFKKHNVENYFDKLNKPSVEKFQNKSNEEKQQACKSTFKAISNKQTFDVSFDKLYDEILSIVIEKKHKKYEAIKVIFYSENPNIKEIIDLASLDERNAKSCPRCSFNLLYHAYYFFNQAAMCEQEEFSPTINKE